MVAWVFLTGPFSGKLYHIPAQKTVLAFKTRNVCETSQKNNHVGKKNVE